MALEFLKEAKITVRAVAKERSLYSVIAGTLYPDVLPLYAVAWSEPICDVPIAVTRKIRSLIHAPLRGVCHPPPPGVSECGKRFTTYEYVEDVSLMVIKKDAGASPLTARRSFWLDQGLRENGRSASSSSKISLPD